MKIKMKYMMTLLKINNVLPAVYISAALLTQAKAATLVSGLTGGTVTDSQAGLNDLSVGFDFTVGSDPISVTSLGYYDDGGGIDALAELGIYRVSDEALLTSITVPVGSGTGSVIGSYRYFPISSVISLEAGGVYRLMANTGDVGDNNAVPHNALLLSGTASADPAIASIGNYYFENSPAPSIRYTSNAAAVSVNLASFEFSVVPEPNTLLLFGFGSITLLSRRRR